MTGVVTAPTTRCFRLPGPTVVLWRGRPEIAALRVCLAATGVVPVSLIALSTFGMDLRHLALWVGTPAVSVALVLACRCSSARSLLVAGLAAGVVATALYDLSRLGFLWVGAVDRDPIPHIGTALGLEPPLVFGYLWRYLGNGAGLALVFCALGLRGVRAGIAYGLAVCAGLLVTLVVSPHGQDMLFPLETGTVVMAVTGHAIYGAVLGAFPFSGGGRRARTSACRLRRRRVSALRSPVRASSTGFHSVSQGAPLGCSSMVTRVPASSGARWKETVARITGSARTNRTRRWGGSDSRATVLSLATSGPIPTVWWNSLPAAGQDRS